MPLTLSFCITCSLLPGSTQQTRLSQALRTNRQNCYQDLCSRTHNNNITLPGKHMGHRTQKRWLYQYLLISTPYLSLTFVEISMLFCKKDTCIWKYMYMLEVHVHSYTGKPVMHWSLNSIFFFYYLLTPDPAMKTVKSANFTVKKKNFFYYILPLSFSNTIAPTLVLFLMTYQDILSFARYPALPPPSLLSWASFTFFPLPLHMRHIIKWSVNITNYPF